MNKDEILAALEALYAFNYQLCKIGKSPAAQALCELLQLMAIDYATILGIESQIARFTSEEWGKCVRQIAEKVKSQPTINN